MSSAHAHELDTRTQDELLCSPTHKGAAVPYNKDATLPLYTIEHVPEYLADNAYIHRGYRAYYTTWQCIRSVCRLHNESLNIWTHFAGALVFVALAAHLFLATLAPEHRQRVRASSAAAHTTRARVHDHDDHHAAPTLWPFVLFGVYSFGCVACMLCSACYHTMLAHLSERLYRIAHALDYFGITLLIVGSFLPFCFYVFRCAPVWRNAYIGMILAFGVVGMLGPFFRHWTSTAFAHKKILFYVVMAGSGIVPITHMALLRDALALPYVSGLLTMLALYGAGVFVYAFKIPEVFRPGCFDVYGSSHQIFHVLVLGAALTHFFNCVHMYTHLGKLTCDGRHRYMTRTLAAYTYAHMCDVATPRDAVLRLSSAVHYYTTAIAHEQRVAHALSGVCDAMTRLHRDGDAALQTASACAAAAATAAHDAKTTDDCDDDALVVAAAAADVHDAVVTAWLQSLCAHTTTTDEATAATPVAVAAAARVLATSGMLDTLRGTQQRVRAAMARPHARVVRAMAQLRCLTRRVHTTCAHAQRWLLQTPFTLCRLADDDDDEAVEHDDAAADGNVVRCGDATMCTTNEAMQRMRATVLRWRRTR